MRKSAAVKPIVYSHDKRPRQYAAEIMKLTTPEARRIALERVPEIWRAMTKAHVEIEFARRRGR